MNMRINVTGKDAARPVTGRLQARIYAVLIGLALGSPRGRLVC